MRFRRRKQDDDVQVDMTPMLDIVFIMLIFFIVSAVFLDETGVDITEPPTGETNDIRLPSILVQIDEKDDTYVDGSRVQLASIPARIEALRAHEPSAVVLVRANSAASVDSVVFLKDQLDAAAVPVSIKVDR